MATARKKTKSQGVHDAVVIERRAMALNLRKGGASYREIAASMKGQPFVTKRYNESLAYLDVTFELKRLNEKNAEAANELRRLELERLDRMLSAMDSQVDHGDPTAINTALRIAERRARLLGLDAPAKTELGIRDLEPFILRDPK